MPLTDEIKQAAQNLGALLAAEAAVSEYARLKTLTAQDPDVVTLEASHDALYQSLSERQMKGESLERAELDRYYDLKYQVQENPLIAAREAQLVNVNALFVQAAQHLNRILGVDFNTFARREK